MWQHGDDGGGKRDGARRRREMLVFPPCLNYVARLGNAHVLRGSGVAQSHLQAIGGAESGSERLRSVTHGPGTFKARRNVELDKAKPSTADLDASTTSSQPAQTPDDNPRLHTDALISHGHYTHVACRPAFAIPLSNHGADQFGPKEPLSKGPELHLGQLLQQGLHRSGLCRQSSG